VTFYLFKNTTQMEAKLAGLIDRLEVVLQRAEAAGLGNGSP